MGDLVLSPGTAGDHATRLAGMFAPAARSRLWLLLGAFALLGLFALHGLGGHGLHHGAVSVSGHDAAASVSGSMSSVGHDDLQAAGDGCNGSCGSVAVGDAREDAGGEIAGWTLALCLGVLIAGAAAITLAVRALRPDVLRVVAGSQTAFVWSSARDHDPPCLFSLSVQRC